VYGLNSSLNSMIFFGNKALLRKEACAISWLHFVEAV
jgi:hypothetical protein